MTWIKFATWLLGSYSTYYAALIFWEYLHTGRGEPGNDRHELTFVEDFEPVKSLVDETANGKESSVTFSGGVSLKQLFNLAREESVEYIKSVSF